MGLLDRLAMLGISRDDLKNDLRPIITEVIREVQREDSKNFVKAVQSPELAKCLKELAIMTGPKK